MLNSLAVENANRCLKIFKILSYPYRNRRYKFGLRSHLIAGIYNNDLGSANIRSPYEGAILSPWANACSQGFKRKVLCINSTFLYANLKFY